MADAKTFHFDFANSLFMTDFSTGSRGAEDGLIGDILSRFDRKV